MSERTAKLTKKFICTAWALSLVGVGVVAEMSEGSNEDTEPAAQNDMEVSNDSGQGVVYPVDDEPYADQELLDSHGRKYTLHQNEDGTETARYDNGEEVTFRRDEHGNVNYCSGTAPLAAVLASYFLFHGFVYPSGSVSAAGFTANAPLRTISASYRAEAMRKYTPAGGKIQDIKTPVGVYQDRENQSGGSSDSGGGSRTRKSSDSSKGNSSVGSTKSGFGSAGARSASS